MEAPRNLLITEPLHEGYPAEISWSPVSGASGYTLERRFDKLFEDESSAIWSDIDAMDFTWDQFDEADYMWDELDEYIPSYSFEIYSGPENEFTDYITDTVRNVIYRVRAYIDNELTWDEIDDKDLSWDEFDALDLPWEYERSDWNTSEYLPVLANQPPIISGQDENLGFRYEPFDITFSVEDPEPSDTVSVSVTVAGSILANWGQVIQGQEYTFTVIPENYSQTQVQVIITATDNRGLASQRIYTFHSPGNIGFQSIFYIYRDGIPVGKTKGGFEWNDYLEVGRHEYYVSGLINGIAVDSNVVVIEIDMELASLALAENPGDMLDLVIRRDQPPQISRSRSDRFEEIKYIGLKYPRFRYKDGEALQISFTFTITNYESYKRLMSLLEPGDPLVYRDKYYNRIIGIIENDAIDFHSRDEDQWFNFVADFSYTIIQCAYDEEVYFD